MANKQVQRGSSRWELCGPVLMLVVFPLHIALKHNSLITPRRSRMRCSAVLLTVRWGPKRMGPIQVHVWIRRHVLSIVFIARASRTHDEPGASPCHLSASTVLAATRSQTSNMSPSKKKSLARRIAVSLFFCSGRTVQVCMGECVCAVTNAKQERAQWARPRPPCIRPRATRTDPRPSRMG